MASDALWIVSFKCVVKGYWKCHFDVKDGEVFKVLKKIGETGPPGGGGYSHIWAIRVCAAQQGTVFCFSDSGTG